MKQKKSLFKRIITIIYYVIIVVVVAFCGFTVVIRATGGVPNIFGYNVCVVATPSMTPELEVNDVIISKVYDDNMVLEVGEIISYNGKEGTYAGKQITHRIVAITGEGESTVITTKGDANTTEDPKITISQVVSVYVRKSPVITFVYQIFSSVFGFIAIILLLIGLIISEVYSYVKARSENPKEVKNEN